MDDGSTEIDGRRTDTRERALGVASRLFRERGYSATSLQEIANELGVTKAALYYHFDSKIEILRALVEPIFSALEDVLAGDVDCSTARGRREFLSALIATFDAMGPEITSITIDPRAAADLKDAVFAGPLPERIAIHLVEGLVREGRANQIEAEIRVGGAIMSVYGMVEAWIHASKGTGPMDRDTSELLVAVASAALET
jgi:AcrR family transcriptional regulator